tara:strand:+ start:58 stop:171 length:114 start_codon:yes stop_codon:yes gene_type:complete
MGKQPEIIKILLDSGVEINLESKNGSNAGGTIPKTAE